MSGQLNIRIRFLSILFISLCSFNGFAESTIWKKELDQDGVAVFLRAAEGFEVQEFLATVTIKGSVNSVFSIFEDIENYPEWLADCTHGALVKQVNAIENVAHLMFDSPWPVEDRDVTFYRTIGKTERGGLILNFVARSGFMETQKCCVRISKAKGYFKVEPSEEDEMVLVSYQFVADPGGDLPAWLMNYIVTDAPLETLSDFKHYAAKKLTGQ